MVFVYEIRGGFYTYMGRCAAAPPSSRAASRAAVRCWLPATPRSERCAVGHQGQVRERGADQARLGGGRVVPRGQALVGPRLRAAAARPDPQAVPRDGEARPSSPRRAGGSVPADEGQQHRGLQSDVRHRLHGVGEPAQARRHGHRHDRLQGPEEGHQGGWCRARQGG